VRDAHEAIEPVRAEDAAWLLEAIEEDIEQLVDRDPSGRGDCALIAQA
jgi:reverse gyrase